MMVRYKGEDESNFAKQERAAAEFQRTLDARHHPECTFVHDEVTCHPDCDVLKALMGDHPSVEEMLEVLVGDKKGE